MTFFFFFKICLSYMYESFPVYLSGHQVHAVLVGSRRGQQNPVPGIAFNSYNFILNFYLFFNFVD